MAKKTELKDGDSCPKCKIVLIDDPNHVKGLPCWLLHETSMTVLCEDLVYKEG